MLLEILLMRPAAFNDLSSHGTFISLIIPADACRPEELSRRHVAAARGLQVPVLLKLEYPVKDVSALRALVSVGWHLFPWINNL